MNRFTTPIDALLNIEIIAKRVPVPSVIDLERSKVDVDIPFFHQSLQDSLTCSLIPTIHRSAV